MATNMFLQIDSVDGESTDSKHKKWIEIAAYSFKVEQPQTSSTSSSGFRTGGRADVRNFTFLHSVDFASAKLFEYCCKGQPVKKATFHICRHISGEPVTYLQYDFTDLIIASIETFQPRAGDKYNFPLDTLSMEEFAFNFAKVVETYTQTDHLTGAKGGTMIGSWDIAQNIK